MTTESILSEFDKEIPPVFSKSGGSFGVVNRNKAKAFLSSKLKEMEEDKQQAVFDASMVGEELRATIWKLYDDNKDWFPGETMPKTEPFFSIWKTIKEIALQGGKE